MIRIGFIFLFLTAFAVSQSQNISIDFRYRNVIGIGATGDTSILLCESKQYDSLFYPVVYKRDTVAWGGKVFFHKEDFDSLANRMYGKGGSLTKNGFVLKNKAKVHLKKMSRYRVGMSPTFGWYVGKKKPGRFTQVIYRLQIENKETGYTQESHIYYYFQKQSFFKRFFKKHKLKKRLKRLPVLAGTRGMEVMFKNAMIQEGGNVKDNYYVMRLERKAVK